MSFNVETQRKKFPSLFNSSDSSSIPIYFDNPAGTQTPQQVIDAVGEYYKTMNSNSGGLFPTSLKNDEMVRRTRNKVAQFLNAPNDDEIVFGPNITSMIFHLSRALAHTLSPGDDIVLTRLDHDANIAPWLRIAEEYKLNIKWVDINSEDCTLNLESFKKALKGKPKIVATTHASNAVGTITPIREIAQMAHSVGALHIVDAGQSAPHIPVNVQDIGCDFLLCSSYKFFGPHLGIMWGRYELLSSLPVYNVRPAQKDPPNRWEVGTLPYELIYGLGATMDYIKETGAGSYERAMEAIREYERSLTTKLISMLQTFPNILVTGILEPRKFDMRVPTVAFVHGEITPHVITEKLAHAGIYVRHGNYCSIEIMNRLGHVKHGMVRVGLTHYNTMEEIYKLELALQTFCSD